MAKFGLGVEDFHFTDDKAAVIADVLAKELFPARGRHGAGIELLPTLPPRYRSSVEELRVPLVPWI